MYLHCRHGFVEADAWDGQPLPLRGHQMILDALARVFGTVVVVRSRRADTLQALVEHLPRRIAGGVLPRITELKSPPGWDYEWRTYLTPVEWGMCMTRVAMDLDYRNFKHTAHDGKDINRREYDLALGIWNAAYRSVPREGHTPDDTFREDPPDDQCLCLRGSPGSNEDCKVHWPSAHGVTQ